MSDSSLPAPDPGDNQSGKATQAGDVNLNFADNAQVGGDVVGRDKIETTTAGGHVIRAEKGATVIIGAPPPQPPTDDAPAPGEPPFKGLQYFDEKDAQLFFGRELLTAKLVGQLREHHFLAVVGASGSGKSSLVRAGMLPAVRSGELLVDGTLPPAGSPRWLIHIITPTAHPLKALAASLTQHSESVTATTTLMDDLTRDPRSLDMTAARLVSSAAAERLLLVVDQFEELFTACKDETERRQFVDTLLSAVGPETDGPTTVILTLRADFYAHCFQFDQLREVLEKRQATVGPMTTEELRRAIEEPARQSGWDFQPRLVDVILEDVGAGEGRRPEPGALPLLSHALLETWQRRRGHTLTLDGYDEAGGVSGAIAKTAETAYQGLKPEQQIIARSIFLRLTELGEGTQDTRRRAALDELILHPEDKPRVEEVLRTLTGVNVRLLVIDRDPAGEEMVEVAHEALIREWDTLRAWLNENREGLRLHRHLTESAEAWAKLKRDPGELYRGARLAQAVEWAEIHQAEINAAEREFLEASRAQQRGELEAAQKRAAQLRKRALYLAGALVLAVVMALVAAFLGYQSSLYAASAQRQSRLSTARALAAAALSNVGIDPNRSILLAMQAVTTTYTVDNKLVVLEAEEALHQAVQASHVQLTLTGHTDAVFGIAFSPDGTRLATASADSTAKVWDATTGKELLTLTGHTDRVYGIAFSPDGTRLATASWDKTAKVWDATTGKELLTLTGHTDRVFGIAFSPDGTRLATASWDKTAKVWDATTGKELLTLTGHTDRVYGIAFSPDGKHLATASADKTAKVWEATTGKELLTLTGHTATAYGIAFSPDGTRLATASGDSTAKVWDAATGKELLTLTGHTDAVFGIAFGPDGKRLTTASRDKTAKVRDATTGKELLTLTGHSATVFGIAFSPDGKHLATASADKTAKGWDATTGKELLTLTGHTAGVLGIAFSPDGTRLATVSADKTAKVWDATTGKELLTLTGHTDRVFDIAFSRDGKRLATASWDKTAKVWDATTGKELLTLTGHTEAVYGIAFSPDGKRLATASWDKTAKVWDATTGKELLTLTGHTDVVYGIAFSPDGKHLATASADTTAKVWDATTGNELLTLTGHTDAVYGIAFSPDGTRLATAGWDKTAKVWDATTGKELLTLTGHTDAVYGIAFSPEGKRLATTSRDKTAKVWDATTGNELLTLTGHTDRVYGIAFSPDGKHLATASADGTVQVYALSIEDLMALARSRLTRTWTLDECKKYLQTDTCPPTP
jgi:WD40 repeat protein